MVAQTQKHLVMEDNIIVIGNWIFIKIEESFDSFVKGSEPKYASCGRHGGINMQYIYTKAELLKRSSDAKLLKGINPTNNISTKDE